MQVLSEETILPFYLPYRTCEFAIMHLGPSITLNCKYVHAYHNELKRGKKSFLDLVDDFMKGIF